VTRLRWFDANILALLVTICHIRPRTVAAALTTRAAMTATYLRTDRWRVQNAERVTAIQKAEQQQCGTRRSEQENGRQMSVLSGGGEEAGVVGFDSNLKHNRKEATREASKDREVGSASMVVTALRKSHYGNKRRLSGRKGCRASKSMKTPLWRF
jgi:hypothetical protein